MPFIFQCFLFNKDCLLPDKLETIYNELEQTDDYTSKFSFLYNIYCEFKLEKVDSQFILLINNVNNKYTLNHITTIINNIIKDILFETEFIYSISNILNDIDNLDTIIKSEIDIINTNEHKKVDKQINQLKSNKLSSKLDFDMLDLQNIDIDDIGLENNIDLGSGLLENLEIDLDIDTVNKLCWKEFIHDNSFFGRYGSNDRYEQSVKYSGPLTWEEINAIPDITLTNNDQEAYGNRFSIDRSI